MYLVEFFLPRGRMGDAPAVAARLERAAGEIAGEGMAVRVVQALAITDAELFQCVLEAPSPDVAADVRRRAGLSAASEPEQVDVLPLPRTDEGDITCRSADEPPPRSRG